MSEAKTIRATCGTRANARLRSPNELPTAMNVARERSAQNLTSGAFGGRDRCALNHAVLLIQDAFANSSDGHSDDLIKSVIATLARTTPTSFSRSTVSTNCWASFSALP